MGKKKEPGPALPARNQGENLGVRTQQPSLCLGEDAPGGITQGTQVPGCEACWKVISSGNLGEKECFREVGLGKKLHCGLGTTFLTGNGQDGPFWVKSVHLGFSFLLLLLLSIFSRDSPPQLGVQHPKSGGRAGTGTNVLEGAGDGTPPVGTQEGHRTLGLGSWGILWGGGAL